MATLRIFTGGGGLENQYPLSASIHFAITINNTETILNHGYGMLFAPGVVLPDNTIAERLPASPSFVHTGSGWAIACICTNLRHMQIGTDMLLLWHTDDFIHFTGPELVGANRCPDYDPIDPVETVEITDDMANELLRRWPAAPVQETARFPLADGYADPVLMLRNGQWYFIATNDLTGNVGLYIRRADTMMGLFDPQTKEHLILDRDEERDFVQTFWAPEFHEIGGRLYILMAIGGKVWGPQCHMLRLREGGDLTCADDWETPVKVIRRDGTQLASEGISLDMTYIHAESGHYLCWSYREHIGSSKDTGSMLMIARIDPQTPWQLTTDPVLLSRPLYAWENRDRTINNEGPYPLYSAGKVYLGYSAGAAGGESYAMGLLTADSAADLTDPSVWVKAPAPVLHSRRVANVYGPGHHACFTDEQGQVWMSYHAQLSPEDKLRRTAIHPIYFTESGEPIFDLHRR